MTVLTGKGPSAEQWANQICSQLSKSAEAIIATGRLLVKAKDDLPHGEWLRMFEEKLIPFGIDNAQKLMKIAKDPQLSNTAHMRHLPSALTTLYELTKVPEKALDNAFRDGLITPSMERREVKALMPIERSESSSVTSAAPQREQPEQRASPRVAGPPSNGMQFARLAVLRLEEISGEDLERQQAFQHVRSWLDARET